MHLPSSPMASHRGGWGQPLDSGTTGLALAVLGLGILAPFEVGWILVPTSYSIARDSIASSQIRARLGGKDG